MPLDTELTEVLTELKAQTSIIPEGQPYAARVAFVRDHLDRVQLALAMATTNREIAGALSAMSEIMWELIKVIVPKEVEGESQ